MIVGATLRGRRSPELHAATIAIVAEVPLATLWHAVPAFPTRSELWLRLLETYGIQEAEWSVMNDRGTVPGTRPFGTVSSRLGGNAHDVAMRALDDLLIRLFDEGGSRAACCRSRNARSLPLESRWSPWTYEARPRIASRLS